MSVKEILVFSWYMPRFIYKPLPFVYILIGIMGALTVTSSMVGSLMSFLLLMFGVFRMLQRT